MGLDDLVVMILFGIYTNDNSTSAAKAAIENTLVIAALKCCANQNQVQPGFFRELLGLGGVMFRNVRGQLAHEKFFHKIGGSGGSDPDRRVFEG
jgi:hypothetical protein